MFYKFIKGLDYARITDAASLFTCNAKPGYIDTADDPYRSVRTGLLGEQGFAMEYGLEVNLTKKKHDITDFVINHWFVDVKTVNVDSWWKGKPFLIEKEDRWGQPYALKSSHYVFAAVTHESRRVPVGWGSKPFDVGASVVVLGWLSRSDVVKLRAERYPAGHANYEISQDILKSMESLDILPQCTNVALECV